MSQQKQLSRRAVLKTVGGASAGVFGLTAGTGINSAQELTGSVTPTEVRVGETVTATVNSTQSGTISVAIIWGDGTVDRASGNSATFTHSYSAPGSYSVNGGATFSNNTALGFIIDTVTVTDAPGRSGDAPGQNKVEICHKGRTIEVPPSAVDPHRAHGDTFGPCEEDS
ncbi:hypothetical protein [Haladaptatus sp. DFWS20]|uniref:hypothetical protein n=1 Tax=Haladaptatus sp. DFWS20 TaxID=3403467 RepID=UPI003EBF2D16